MESTNGLLTEVRWEWLGTALTSDAASGVDTIFVADSETVADEEVIWIGGSGPYTITALDVEADEITIDPVLMAPFEEGIEVVPDVGGQPGQAWVAEVLLPDAEEPIEVPLTVHDLSVMAEGTYNPPIAIIISDDLEHVLDLPGTLPVVSTNYIPDFPDPDAVGSTVYRQDEPPWPDGEGGHPDNDLWYDTNYPDGITPFLWDADNLIWVDASDPQVDLLADPESIPIGDTTLGEILALIENNTELATDALNLASTADGRISISDYDPAPSDILYYATDNNGDLMRGAAWNIVEAELTSGIATLTLDDIGGMTMGVGEYIIVTDTGTPFDGAWLVESFDNTGPITVSYRIAGASNIANHAVTGIGYNTLLQNRIPGSMWYTRSRARKNFCSNPSFEIALTGWVAVQATPTRVVGASTIVGTYIARVANSAVAGDHTYTWSGSGAVSGMPVLEGQSWSATAFALLDTGSGVGCYASMRFYDAAHALVSEVNGPAIDLSTTDWMELSVNGTVPSGVTSMAAIVLHNPNTSAAWFVDAGLVEQAEFTGRYFDGNSYDGSWLGTPDASASILTGGKIVSVYELYEGNWVRLDFTGSTSYDQDASDLTVGTLPAARIGDNSINVDKLRTNSVRVSDAVVAGDFVNIWDNAGLFLVRPADASIPGREAHGFVLEDAAPGVDVPVYSTGYNPLCTGLTPGPQFLSSTTAGIASRTAPNVAGSIVQTLGWSSDATTLYFHPAQPILLY